MFGLAAVSLLERRQDDAGPCCDIVASAGERPPEGPGADVELPVSETFTLAGRGRVLGADDTRVLSARAVQVVAWRHSPELAMPRIPGRADHQENPSDPA